MILAIESSCDESALALFDPARGLTGEWVHSQIALHREYGGVVPDLASREHLDRLPALLTLAAAEPEFARVTQIAVTQGPGLAGCLALGIALGEALALAHNVPLVGVNHLRGHVWSPFIALHSQDPARFWDNLAPLLPHLGLLVSGGNTLLYRLVSADQQNGGHLTVINRTVDDAAGEALDKGAKLLGLPYPGGPLVEKLAATGDPRRFDFPRALGEGPRSGHVPFSFSGLKTSLRYRLEKMSATEITAARADLCASYQAAVIDQLLAKTAAALDTPEPAHLQQHPDNSAVGASLATAHGIPSTAQSTPIRSLGLSGGVANNTPLRAAFAALAARHNLPCLIAAPPHTGDNAAMIAFAAYADPSHAIPSQSGKPLAFEPSLSLVSELS
jgi:N6-L-threonylcarbamoyladenine synthase